MTNAKALAVFNDDDPHWLAFMANDAQDREKLTSILKDFAENTTTMSDHQRDLAAKHQKLVIANEALHSQLNLIAQKMVDICATKQKVLEEYQVFQNSVRDAEEINDCPTPTVSCETVRNDSSSLQVNKPLIGDQANTYEARNDLQEHELANADDVLNIAFTAVLPTSSTFSSEETSIQFEECKLYYFSVELQKEHFVALGKHSVAVVGTPGNYSLVFCCDDVEIKNKITRDSLLIVRPDDASRHRKERCLLKVGAPEKIFLLQFRTEENALRFMNSFKDIVEAVQ